MISGLLLVGTVIRAKVKFIQTLFLPSSLIAGFIGLGLGPSGLNILPFSSQMSTYPGLLIAVIFAAIPIGAPKIIVSEIIHRVREMWSYSMLLTVIMWGGGALFGLVLLNQVFRDLPEGFGLMLGAGFLGGHGTAAALGEVFSKHGWEEAMTLGMTAATVGILVAVIGGIIIIKRSTERGHTSFISNFNNLPEELKTGLIKSKRSSMGEETVSSSAIDPLVLHISLITLIVGLAYKLTTIGQEFMGNIALPLFSIAFLIALLLQFGLRKTNTDHYFDHRIMTRLSGSATDYLVALGIASIKISVVIDYAIPLLVLFIFGTILAYLIFMVIGPNIFRDFWFEKSIFGWGWSTGTVAMGLALLRIVDPELKSKTTDDYALAYIGMVPVEITIITMAPVLYTSGLSWVFPIVLLAVGFLIIYLHKMKNLWGNRELPVHKTKRIV
jgi:glutamate:Na+ symporter, ESS family